MRVWCLSLLVVWSADSASAGRAVQRAGVLQKITSVVAAGLLASGVAVAQQNNAEIEAAWQEVRQKPPAHQRSAFYLLLDAFDSGWLVMHIQYVGMNRGGEPLFIGPRAYILGGVKGNGEREFIFHRVITSLVNYRGLVKQNVEVEEVAHFAHPEMRGRDLTLLTIKGVDLGDYEPIEVAPYPSADTELEMLSYWIEEDNLLKFFDYPLFKRECQTKKFVAEDETMAIHDCLIPQGMFYVGASPIFNKEDQTLVALNVGLIDDGLAFGTEILPELRAYMSQTLDVNAQGKMATVWGKLKAEGR